MEEYRTLAISGGTIPVKLVRERRSSVRAYLGKEHLIIRVPKNLSATEEQQHWERLVTWVEAQVAKRPGILERYQHADYQDGDTLRVGQRQYQLRIKEAPRKTHGGKLRNGTIELTLRSDADPNERSSAIRSLLSRLIGKDYLPYITGRVHHLNDRFFKQPIKGVKLKYNHSNWGSCSNTGNINLSTRLLFAPPAVIDYVIIHELAHLIELNHSGRFWKLVAQAMPNYQEQEAWLSEFGFQCDF